MAGRMLVAALLGLVTAGCIDSLGDCEAAEYIAQDAAALCASITDPDEHERCVQGELGSAIYLKLRCLQFRDEQWNGSQP